MKNLFQIYLYIGISIIFFNCSSEVTAPVEDLVPKVVLAPDVVFEEFAVKISGRENSFSTALDVVGSKNINFKASLKNEGDGPLSAGIVNYYLSTDSSTSSTETKVGPSDFLYSFGPEDTTTLGITIKAPLQVGTYYYIACLEDSENTIIRCSNSATLTVVEFPDLVVESFLVDNSIGPLDKFGGETINFKTTVRNQGTTSTTTIGRLRYFLSDDPEITIADTEIARGNNFPILAANAASEQTSSAEAPSNDGAYYYGACIDGQNNEVSKENNCSSAVKINAGGPDLVIQSFTANTIKGILPFLNYTVVIKNEGIHPTPESRLTILASILNPNVDSDDRKIETINIPALEPDETFSFSNANISIYGLLPGGTIFYGVCVDAVANESNVRNNCGNNNTSSNSNNSDTSNGSENSNDSGSSPTGGFNLFSNLFRR